MRIPNARMARDKGTRARKGWAVLDAEPWWERPRSLLKGDGTWGGAACPAPRLGTARPRGRETGSIPRERLQPAQQRCQRTQRRDELFPPGEPATFRSPGSSLAVQSHLGTPKPPPPRSALTALRTPSAEPLPSAPPTRPLRQLTNAASQSAGVTPLRPQPSAFPPPKKKPPRLPTPACARTHVSTRGLPHTHGRLAGRAVPVPLPPAAARSPRRPGPRFPPSALPRRAATAFPEAGRLAAEPSCN